VRRIGPAEVGCEEGVAVDYDHRALWVIERRPGFSEASSGAKKLDFTRKTQVYAPGTDSLEGGFHQLGLWVGIGYDASDAASRQVFHRETRERTIRDGDDGLGSPVGERPEARPQSGC
jgi:hypothetical protein